MKRVFATLLFTVIVIVSAGQNTQYSSGEFIQALKKLNTVGSVLYIAAHPDDENTRFITYMSKEKNFRTSYLSLTRGDGGQNLIGKEQGEALGLIRTNELLQARRVDGGEQFFTRAYDFGYSKNPDETLKFWNRDSVLSDVVRVIRMVKPDLIVCRFPSTGEGGHGHHTASAILALEAFEKAADEKYFPGQLKTNSVWKAKRIAWNTFNFGSTNTTSEEQLKVDVGLYNTLLGKSYGEIAAESRSMHKSQGFGSAKTRGSSIEYFKFLKGDSAKTDLFEGVNSTWTRIKNGSVIESKIQSVLKAFDPTHPEKSLTDLISIHKLISEIDEKDDFSKTWKQIKLSEAENLILSAAGIIIEPQSNDFKVVPGKSFSLTTNIISRNSSDVMINSITFPEDSDTSLNKLSLKLNQPVLFKHTAIVPASLPYSTPYWLALPRKETGSFESVDKQFYRPENNPPLKVRVNMVILGQAFSITREVIYKSTDPVKGEIYRPVEVLPPVTINLPENIFVFTESLGRAVTIKISTNTANVNGKIKITVPDGWKTDKQEFSFMKASRGDTSISFVLSPDSKNREGKILITFSDELKEYSESISRINYDHIPAQFYLSKSEVKVKFIDLKKSSGRIAYIPGAGDNVAQSLQQAGYSVTILSPEDLANSDLSAFSAIVTGIRAYNVSDELHNHYNKLMDYVKQGGNLIVQYNTNNRFGPVNSKIGPYDFKISRERVTNENSEISFLIPDHPALNFPNTITKDDFNNWIQERGIYFATDAKTPFVSPLSMSDPKEEAKSGALIIAPYGKGNFVYTGIVFFRQLPAGVEGAYRLFANLLALPQNSSK